MDKDKDRDKAPGRKELTHERIVGVAAKAIRRSGYAGTGVADIMKEAGLTHGGFYAHFSSRNALLAEAVHRAGRDGAEYLATVIAEKRRRGASPLRALVESYLHDRSLDSQEGGCVIAALSSEMPRQAPEVQAASAERVRALIGRVQEALPEGSASTKATAALVASTMVGALQLARAVADPVEGKAILKAARQGLVERFDST